MRVLATMPGRHGDILWALPTVRALAEREGRPVDLLISAKYGSLVELIQRQPYIACVTAHPGWAVEETAPMTPRTPPFDDAGYDLVFHLGYEGWPQAPLPYDIAARAGVAIDLGRPWITSAAERLPYGAPIAVGFTDEHFELKLGIDCLLFQHFKLTDLVNLSTSPRWCDPQEGAQAGRTWAQAAQWLTQAQVFVGCCSALHVLAVAMGVPAVIVEPAPARRQPVFWPLGMDGPPVAIVRGGDGQPTVDARHTIEAVEARLPCA